MRKRLLIIFCLWSFNALHAQEKKEAAPISYIPYDNVSLNDIKNVQLIVSPSIYLGQGAEKILYYRTNEGRYGKMEHVGNNAQRSIFIRWTTYNPDGSIYSGGQANLEVPQYEGCDLDQGIIKTEGSEFTWNYRYGSRYNPGGNDLIPKNGAVFRSFSTRSSRMTGSKSEEALVQTKIPQQPVSNSVPSTSTPSAGITPQRRLALIIGNAAYLDPKQALNNPVNDATDITAALREMGFEVITATNANRQKMEAVIEDFGIRLKNYNLGFFFYAGHGLQIEGENYLVPIDAKLLSQGEVKYECYPVGRILAKMEEAAVQANVIVLDACRDNPLARSWSRSLNTGGLANMNAPQGTFIGFATSPGEKASDGTGRNGVYTAALLEHLRKPNQTLDQLFNAVSGSVKRNTNNLQVPWKTSSLSEDLYLRN
jgi:hypothetical protein